MAFARAKPPAEWTPDDVGIFLAEQGLQYLAPAFRANAVSGADLLCLTEADLTSPPFSATPFQARRLVQVVHMLAPAAAPSAYYTATRSLPDPERPAGYPPPLSPSYPVPQSYPPAAPASQLQLHSSGSAALAQTPSLPLSQAGSREIEDLRAQLEMQKMRGDMREETAVRMHLAALEGRVAAEKQAAPAPMVVNVNQGGGYGVVAPMYTERYCGPISWIIGLFLLPCICFCPVDQRRVGAVVLP